MQFADLNFQPHPNMPENGGVQALVFFPNGYGASVVRFKYSYGGENGLYELAVAHGSADDWSICYATPITTDVEGHLSEGAVTDLLTRIEALPANEAIHCSHKAEVAEAV